ncbi:hypothetical protein JYU34_005621 [Plutella xylostella]|uniref:Guanylate cyclase domain-containing protein n=1 Tax=Plutella xylostella TaxID=51655 RepID=A0ABQ7QTT6_PLUXY|nr:hypothetical protein JYU34_005621 [Plutella xylostella]
MFSFTVRGRGLVNIDHIDSSFIIRHPCALHFWWMLKSFTKSIELSTQRLEAEKQKSDLLLSRMLPLPVLRRLRAQKTVPAESFDAVTIFFSDIVGFTTISANSTPMEIILDY